MKNVPSSKKLTFLYFSVVAFALIVLHLSVFELTSEGIEHAYAKNRLDMVHRYANNLHAKSDLSGQDTLELKLHADSSLYKNPVYYFNWDELPDGFPDPKSITSSKDLKVKTLEGEHTYLSGVQI